MIFTVKELIDLLRNAVNIQNKDSEVEDPGFSAMTDEDLTMFLKMGMSCVYPSIENFEDLPTGADFPLVLVAKKELYLRLAVLTADFYDLTADNNNQLKRSQRFSHYMTLAQQAKDDYDDWVKNGGGSLNVDSDTGIEGVRTYDVIRSKNHYTTRNYEKSIPPKVRIKIHEITNDSVAFGWSSFLNDHFGKYLVYISENPIVNIYNEGMTAESKVYEDATLVMSTLDFRNTNKKITGLKPDTLYFIVVFSVERNQLFGYSQISFTTLSPLEEGEINIDSIGGG